MYFRAITMREKRKKLVDYALIAYKASEKDDINEINYQYASVVCNSSDGYDNIPVINTIMR
jgi:hypothetical protein